jgi:uncharacterized iron-regulated membrane protein
MIRLSQDNAKSLLAIHGWSGALLGLLLYAVILTGVIAVFADEIGGWSSPLQHEPAAALPKGLGAKLAELSTQVDEQYHDDLFFFPQAGGRIRTFFHKDIVVDGQPSAEGVEFDLDPNTLAVLDRREGISEVIQEHNTAGALSAFLVDLHVRLHVPNPWGLLLTGALGLAMMVAAVSGLIVHRHLLRELFTIRRRRQDLLAKRDAHVIAGTWNLPFAFILAFTGSFFSFASTVGIPVVAMVAFGGDQEKLIETVVGVPPVEDKTPKPLADLDAMIADAHSRVGVAPSFVSIEHYGRADARVSVFTPPSEGRVTSNNLVYDGASGAFMHLKPGLGLVPSAGGLLFDLMGPLHFGNFAGVLSKAVWFALGFAACYVTLTGMLLWTTRRAESAAWQRLARATIWVGYGLPLSLAASPIGFFIGRSLGLVELHDSMAIAFLSAAALAGALALSLCDLENLRRVLLAATGLVLLSLPLLRLATGGPGWSSALANGLQPVFSLDLAMLVGGLLCGFAARKPNARLAAAARSGLDEHESQLA